MKNMKNDMKETGDFEGYMLEICDLLENGDAAIDFAERDQQHEAAVIRIIAGIVRNELNSIIEMRRIRVEFAKFYESDKDDDKGATK